ncbi:MAG: hypothetical protein M1826_001193 [Phylliscum demangeonii]|nr:MAG: hypothetical protein M1826_001193 [Phylliscum demangeonii]
MACNVLVIGAVNGHLADITQKLSTLHAKNLFAFAIIAGDLFADPSASDPRSDEELTALLNGSISVPCTTYFTVGQHPLPPRVIERLASSEGEVCENLFFLGKSATLSTAAGIRVAALGGRLDANPTASTSARASAIDEYSPLHTAADAKRLHGAKEVDILLTAVWPAGIRRRSRIALPAGAEEPAGSELAAELCTRVKPRYHFSAAPEIFFERDPFLHPSSEESTDSGRITRFISLASFRNNRKHKSLYAFKLELHPDRSAPPPIDTTGSPFSLMARKQGVPLEARQKYSRFAAAAPDGRPAKRARPPAPPPPGPEQCFFCLSNPSVATHLVTSIGTEAYLTVARGPLSTADTFAALPFSAHVLIIPVSHSATLAEMADAAERDATFAEMMRYRRALHDMVVSYSAGRLGTVTWEVNRRVGVHAHWQFLPLGDDLIGKGLVEAAFKVEAENDKYPAFATEDASTITAVSETGDFFRVWISRPGITKSESEPIPEGKREPEAELQPAAATKAETTARTAGDGGATDEKCMIMRLPPPSSAGDRRPFDLQFGRRVLAKLLGLESRMNWKASMQTEADEVADVEALKKAFQPWDFAR